MKAQPSILLIAAMEQEAQPLLQSLGFAPLQEQVRRELPFRRFEANLEGIRVLLSLNGRDKRFGNENVGLEIAALNAYDSIHRFEPQLVINFGTAGSYQHPDVEVGKVFLSKEKFFFHDHRIPLAGYEEYGRGHLPGINTESLAQKLGLPRASVSSGSSLDFTDRDLEEIQRSGATLKEMEAGAIAWACYLMETPFFAVKSVTNIVDRKVSSASEFEKNFHTAVVSLTSATERVLHTLAANPTSLHTGK